MDSELKIIVQKYGGSSVATIEKLQNVARRVVETKRRGYSVVVVVSAMGDSTDDLVALVRQLSANPPGRELDALLVTGEMVSMALLAITIQELGEDAIGLNGLQCGIFTNAVHSNARILEIHPHRLRDHLEGGAIVVVAGFQGVNGNEDFTTLGRGGSDTSAVALAAALKAEQCEIYTDVPGVFTADPRIIPQAQCLKELNAAEMQELAWTGAKVLKAEAVEFASTNSIPIVVRSTFEDGKHTRVRPRSSEEVFVPSRPAVAGVSGREDLLRITFGSSQSFNGDHAAVFDYIAKYDMVFCSAGSGEPLDLFISNLEIPDPVAFAAELYRRFGSVIAIAGQLGMVSLVGFGLGSRPASFLDAFRLLHQTGIPILKSFNSRESFCFVIPVVRVQEAVRLMHRAFLEEEVFRALAHAGQRTS